MSKLILADSIPEIQKMKSECVDLVLTDPPYGIDFAKQSSTSCMGRGTTGSWDSSIPTAAAFQEILRVAKRHIIWGGNYFAHQLPPSRGWLVWYKMDGLPPLQFSECEMAWTSCSTKSKVFNCRHRGFPQRLQGDARRAPDTESTGSHEVVHRTFL